MDPVKPSPYANFTATSVLVVIFATATMATTGAMPQTAGTRVEKKLPVVAVLVGNRVVLDWILTGMRDIGYVAERDFHLEARLTEGIAEKQSQFADDIVALQPDVVITGAALELKKRTSVLPIVLDGRGVLEATALTMMHSLEHPGGNVTGVVEGAAGVRDARRLSFLKEAVPGLTRVAVLGPGVKPEVRTAAVTLGLQLDFVAFTSADQIEAAFDKLAAKAPQALWVPSGAFSLANISKIASLAAARKWPSISESRELPASGGLMSYGGFGDPRRVAQYVDRILKGAKPGDLPAEIEQQRWELVINLKSAQQLGITIPDSVLAQAAEIIR